MIKSVNVSAMKSIKEMKIDCKELNLFVGTNSSGKSTFLQALLLLKQHKLNGRYISLGDFREVRNYSLPNNSIKIEVTQTDTNQTEVVEYIEDKERDTYNIDIYFLNSNGEHKKIGKNSKSFMYSSNKFHYLSCHRIGVNDIYSKNMVDEKDFGIDGEYSLAYLLKNEGENIDEELLVKDSSITSSLLEQVNYWLYYIVDMKLSINDIKKTNYLQVKYNNNPANASSEALYCRPVNVGSGISYLISIIIICLGSEKDSIIIIENPEIHLHPKAQSRLCDFLYFISKAKRQIFVETHSDHIFNGLRAGVATSQVNRDDISVNFFALNDRYETESNSIIFGANGSITGENKAMSLNDLFDQFDLDLDKMLGL